MEVTTAEVQEKIAIGISETQEILDRVRTRITNLEKSKAEIERELVEIRGGLADLMAVLPNGSSPVAGKVKCPTCAKFYKEGASMRLHERRAHGKK